MKRCQLLAYLIHNPNFLFVILNIKSSYYDKTNRRESDNLSLSNKSKATQVLHIFINGKKPIDVAIELDLPKSEISEICDLQQEFWALHQLYDLPLVYQQPENDL
jgi:hypothetical protein